MANCYSAIIYILTSFLTALRGVYILSGVSLIHFFIGLMLFTVSIRYLVKVPSSSIGGLKRSYDRKIARSQYKRSK